MQFHDHKTSSRLSVFTHGTLVVNPAERCDTATTKCQYPFARKKKKSTHDNCEFSRILDQTEACEVAISHNWTLIVILHSTKTVIWVLSERVTSHTCLSTTHFLKSPPYWYRSALERTSQVLKSELKFWPKYRNILRQGLLVEEN